MVKVDPMRCQAVIDLLRAEVVPEDREDTSLPGLPRAALPNFLLMVVAICHQTTPATGEPALEGTVEGRDAKGWDYLLRRLASAAERDSHWYDVAAWQLFQGQTLRVALRDTRLGDRLTDPEGRAALVRDMGAKMVARGWRDASDIVTHCDGWLKERQPGILDELAQFQAYRDPVKKKSFYFLSMMRNFGLWTFRDPHNLGPPADYHEVRGHLRIGTVVVDDPDLLGRLVARQLVTVEQDDEIRASVVEAIEMVARGLGITSSRAHYMFWNLFRNICQRDDPQCLNLRPNNPLPDRYQHLTRLAPSANGCPFAGVCQNAGRSAAVMPKDPVVLTDYH